MHELDTSTFRLAVAQFDQAAERMGLDPNLRQRLKLPERSLIVSLPVSCNAVGDILLIAWCEQIGRSAMPRRIGSKS